MAKINDEINIKECPIDAENCTPSSSSQSENTSENITPTEPVINNPGFDNPAEKIQYIINNNNVVVSNCYLNGVKEKNEEDKVRHYVDFYSQDEVRVEDDVNKSLVCGKVKFGEGGEDSLSSGSGAVSDEEAGRCWPDMGLSESASFGRTKESEGSDSGISADVKADSLSSDDLTTGSWEAPLLSVASQVRPKSTLKRPTVCLDPSQPSKKKPKRSIAFGDVDVFYFPRAQGFTCVPSQGGSTLGMQLTHSDRQTFTIAEHFNEQRRVHREMLAQLRNPPGAQMSSSSEEDTDDQNTESEHEIDNYFFLQQPVPTRQRRAILRAAGVRKIESFEKDECKDIRSSREFCGCSCKGFCDPDTCACSQAGIKCQVDRLNFPCGCTHDGCANSNGRIEFNPMRVRTHFIHTMMRIEMEKKQEQEEEARRRELSQPVSAQGFHVYHQSHPAGQSHPRQDLHPHPYGGYHFDGGFSYPSYPTYQAYDTSHFHQYDTFQNNFRYTEEKESFSELLSGARYPEPVIEELQTSSDGGGGGGGGGGQEAALPADKSQDETEGDNFGEIIKKTMVESVTA